MIAIWDTVEIQIIRAKVHVALDHQKQAKDELSSAMNFNPRKPDELLGWPVIQKIVGDTNDAWKLYKKVLFNDPKNCEALLGLAEIASDREEWDAVMMNTKVVLAQIPLSFEAARLQAKRSKSSNVMTSLYIWQNRWLQGILMIDFCHTTLQILFSGKGLRILHLCCQPCAEIRS